MPNYTQNYNLYKPNRADTEEVDTTLSTNFDAIDAEIKNRKDDLDTHTTSTTAHDSSAITHNDSSVKQAISDLESSVSGQQLALDTHKTSNTAHDSENIVHENSNVKQTINDLENRVDSIVADAGNSNTEIVDARGTFTILRDRLNNTDEQLAQKAQQTDLDTTNQNVALKADVTYVDIKTSALASGSPKGVYSTLSALQAAFPTGNSNIYIVSADGNWYFWNGSAWIAGGIYQGIGLDPSYLNAPMSNLIANGNFANGTTGWTLAGATVISSTGNELIINTTAQNNRVYQPIVFNTGDKIYRAALVKATSNQVGLGATSEILTAHSGSGNYEKLTYYGVYNSMYASVVDKRTSGWDGFSVKNMIAINVTQLYGVGKEPTIDVIETLLSAYLNSWFDKTVNSLDGKVKIIDGNLTAKTTQDNSYIQDSFYTNDVHVKDWYIGGLLTDGTDNNVTTRIRSDLIRIKKGTVIKTTDPITNVIAHYYSIADNTHIGTSGSWVTQFTIPDDYNIKLIMRYTDDRAINDTIALGKLCTIEKSFDGNTQVNEYREKARELLYKFPGTLGQSICFVGDELWGFEGNASSDQTTWANCYRYSLDFTTQTATQIGSFTQNWGHCNTVDYCEETDTLILGSGTGLQESSGVGDGGTKGIYILPNASSFKNLTTVPLADYATIIDVSSYNWERQIQVVWGEENNGKHNICYCYTNDGTDADDFSTIKCNMYIRKVLLGQGTNQLENGVFISGKTGLEFNGTFKVLSTYKGDMVYMPYECSQDGDFYNGKLYTGLGHDGVWISELTLNEDGTFDFVRGREKYWYSDDGTSVRLVAQAMTIKDGNLYVRVYEYAGGTVALCVYKL